MKNIIQHAIQRVNLQVALKQLLKRYAKSCRRLRELPCVVSRVAYGGPNPTSHRAILERASDIVSKLADGKRNAGTREVHMRISCPPTISPCFYGVDTPSKRELIAANKSVDEIRKFIDADSLAYLSLEGLKIACADGDKTTYCSACYTGSYPTKIDVEEILPAAGT